MYLEIVSSKIYISLLFVFSVDWTELLVFELHEKQSTPGNYTL